MLFFCTNYIIPAGFLYVNTGGAEVTTKKMLDWQASGGLGTDYFLPGIFCTQPMICPERITVRRE